MLKAQAQHLFQFYLYDTWMDFYVYHLFHFIYSGLEILGGPFLTGGSGIGNPEQIEGPSNSDNEIRITNDKQFLLAVNPGSNTIAVFNINIDGSLWLL
jgi:hypothetical protein